MQNTMLAEPPITTETLRQAVENDQFVLFYGMPSIMLEKTIQFLHEALIKQVPENKPVYDKLLKPADMLAGKRGAPYF